MIKVHSLLPHGPERFVTCRASEGYRRSGLASRSSLQLRLHNVAWHATATQPGAVAACPRRLAQGFHGRVLQGQEVLASQTLTKRAHALHKRSHLSCLIVCGTRMTAALCQPLLPCQPRPPKGSVVVALAQTDGLAVQQRLDGRDRRSAGLL